LRREYKSCSSIKGVRQGRLPVFCIDIVEGGRGKEKGAGSIQRGIKNSYRANVRIAVHIRL
jgi:hypothetical protein